MRDSQDREGSISFRTFAVIAVAFILAVRTAANTLGPCKDAAMRNGTLGSITGRDEWPSTISSR
jgi:hypothetical protein